MLKDCGCGEVGPGQTGNRITLAGWVHRRRDHGGLIFLDLRDVTGLVQVVLDPALAPAAHAAAGDVRSEFVLRITGTVRARPAGTENAALATGAIEVAAESVEVVNRSRPLPFLVSDDADVDEAVRLKHRYLDLRRQRLQGNIVFRHRLIKRLRDFLDERGFFEIETPILVQTSPGGARDYLVPSRVHQGEFFALPQSPQQLKQLLMVAGFERYFQIARCFRDEDQRADRQPEFTQLDLEMSFVEARDVMALSEALLIELAALSPRGYRLRETPFPVLTYDEAMGRYGSDKPDLRFGLELHDVSDLAGETQFNVFKGAVDAGGAVLVLAVPGGAAFSRREIDALGEAAKEAGAKGLAWVALGAGGETGPVTSLADDAIRSPIAKFVPRPVIEAMAERAGAGAGDLLLFGADRREAAQEVLGRLRTRLGHQLGLADPDELAFAWVTDFPLFETSGDGAMVAKHHMFTMPLPGDEGLLETDPLAVRASAYDVVCNGIEVGGGSIRIHQQALQQRVFDALGYDAATVQEQFGAMMEAFSYGAPPHGGIAWGLDRLVMLLAGEPNIREVMAFPKNAAAQDPMLGAPSRVRPDQLAELGISLVDTLPRD